MWAQLLLTLIASIVISADFIELPTGPAGIQRVVSDEVKSMGYKIVYSDENMALINEVVSDVEKSNALKKINLNDAMKPLPAQDVKCLISMDRYCSKEMAVMKSVLVQAIKEDCANCSLQEKDKASKIIASMMVHDPVAWKLFLTRYDELHRFHKILE